MNGRKGALYSLQILTTDTSARNKTRATIRMIKRLWVNKFKSGELDNIDWIVVSDKGIKISTVEKRAVNLIVKSMVFIPPIIILGVKATKYANITKSPPT